MEKVRVTVDVHCTEKFDDSAAYKLFVANALIAERNFVWDPVQKYVQEQMTLSLFPGQYSIEIEPVSGVFVANNLVINDQPQTGLTIDVLNNNR